MEVRRIEEGIYECFVSAEMLQKMKITEKDIIEQSHRAKELVEEMLNDIYEKTGHQPAEPGFPLNMTFMSGEKGIMFYLAAHDNAEPFFKKIEQIQKELVGSGTGEKKKASVYSNANEDMDMLFCFRKITDIMDLKKVLPKDIRAESILYQDEKTYYLLTQNMDNRKEAVSEYFKLCCLLTEFATKNIKKEAAKQIMAKADVVIKKDALQKLTL